MDTISPVVPGLEKYEAQLGGKEAGQPEYAGLKILRSPEGRVMSRWTFTEEERRAIAEGADLFLTVHTFNHPFQPVKIIIADAQDGASPELAEAIKRDMRLEEQAELMALLNEANRTAVAANAARQALEAKQKEVFTPPEPSKIALVH